MHLFFDKAACQNTRRALQHEWLLTNGRGDYASSSILNCNTRKYHGLFVRSTTKGRTVLLSTLEESLFGEEREFLFSTRQHPMTMYPNGYDFQERFSFEDWPVFVYRMGNTYITREMLLVRDDSKLVLRWTITGNGILPTRLRIKPLLACRNFHELTHANDAINGQVRHLTHGFTMTPYEGEPPLYFSYTNEAKFIANPAWYYTVEYLTEHERGFPFQEDLFTPGTIDIPVRKDEPIYMVVGTDPCIESGEILWNRETAFYAKRRREESTNITTHLQRTGNQFIVRAPDHRRCILAGYHWFDAWGRDTLIALPGLTFYSGKTDIGLEILSQLAQSIKNGLIPNMFGPDGHDSYNSVDASLWYAFAVQAYLARNPDGYTWVHEHAWPAIKRIIDGFRKDPGFDIFIDGEGLLHAGNAQTQLTWMDAQVNGKPVTPRHGCVVELNALWYNTLEFAQKLARKFNEPNFDVSDSLHRMRTNFIRRFFIRTGKGGYLGDVWRDGWLDASIRPNQIFAISLPYSIVPEQYQSMIFHCVKDNLLTPYGLRTLAPQDANFKSRYEGGPAERDASYHQGTVWPWLLGHYMDALVRSSWAVEQEIHTFLETVLPLFSEHMLHAGIGTISEIFDAAPPYRPNGCISQAWSVAECIRLLVRAREKAPGVYANFEQKAIQHLMHPTDDTTGRGKLVETFA
ncbi:MAG: glycogen debranching enzyme family protein [Desulfovibrio sp.]|nr:glycogen debranching enzyme family protein [Desulfovibrio sp.]